MLTSREEDIDAAVREVFTPYGLRVADGLGYVSLVGREQVVLEFNQIQAERAEVSQAARTLASARKPSKTAKVHAELAKAVGR